VIFSVRVEFILESIKRGHLTGVTVLKELTMTFMAAVKAERITGQSRLEAGRISVAIPPGPERNRK
jgi:hypothetical protein